MTLFEIGPAAPQSSIHKAVIPPQTRAMIPATDPSDPVASLLFAPPVCESRA